MNVVFAHGAFGALRHTSTHCDLYREYSPFPAFSELGHCSPDVNIVIDHEEMSRTRRRAMRAVDPGPSVVVHVGARLGLLAILGRQLEPRVVAQRPALVLRAGEERAQPVVRRDVPARLVLLLREELAVRCGWHPPHAVLARRARDQPARGTTGQLAHKTRRDA